MKKETYAESTIKRVAKLLKHLQRNCNFSDPEDVKTFVANKKVSNSTKENLIEAYAIYMRSTKQTWNQPFYQRYDKLPKIPTEENIDKIIAPHRNQICFETLEVFPSKSAPISIKQEETHQSYKLQTHQRTNPLIPC